ncbi:uncharacterized protein LOC130666406 [Microplitis mediator]|uniref:uncharacterized protein LOC130666406 n=1 Tax=Microplitis mediator TaxID=375433 RepID=UPI0025533958|nr:uncharacterized protein LOC130666406 [Microplitis mediator]
METVEPVEISTDELTENVRRRNKFNPPLLHAGLTPSCVLGVYKLICYFCGINDPKPFLGFEGILIGLTLSAFIKTLLYNPYDRIKGSKYHFIYFGLFGTGSVAAFSSFALSIFLCTTEEDSTKICGRECPVRQVIYWTAFSYGAGFVLMELLFWVGHKIDVLFYPTLRYLRSYLNPSKWRFQLLRLS